MGSEWVIGEGAGVLSFFVVFWRRGFEGAFVGAVVGLVSMDIEPPALICGFLGLRTVSAGGVVSVIYIGFSK